MKQLYFLDEEEKNRILNLHESATKRHYLGEQQTGAKFIYTNPNDRAYDYKMENNKYYFKGKPNTSYATKYPNWYEAKAQKGIKAIQALFDAGTNVTTTEKPATNTQVKQETNPDPNKAVQDTTKQIQALLGLEQTGNMDSGLLQKINDKLNPQPRPKVEPLQQLGQASVNTQQITTMSPEQSTAGLQQQQKAAEAAKTPLTNKEKRQQRRELRKSNRAELQALRDNQNGNQ